jgi:hypothetical protein
MAENVMCTSGTKEGAGPPVKKVDGAGGAAVAVGSRAHLEAVAISRRAWYRNFLMHGFHFVVLLVAGGAVKDTQCGFKVSLLQLFLAPCR